MLKQRFILLKDGVEILATNSTLTALSLQQKLACELMDKKSNFILIPDDKNYQQKVDNILERTFENL